jgi:5-methylcytosine-specific restriction endonuclease McrA
MARAKRTCTVSSCPNLTDGGACAEHRAASYKAQDRARGKVAERGYGGRQRKWRAVILARDPICVDPKGLHPNEPRASVVADHIQPLQQGGSWAFSNGRGLCVRCHEAVTPRGAVRARSAA